MLKEMKLLTLREVCNELGVSRRAVQGYESLGLVQATSKNKYGYLLYDEVMVEQIRIVKMYRDLGFSGKETKRLLESGEIEQKEMLKMRLLALKENLKDYEQKIILVEKLLN